MLQYLALGDSYTIGELVVNDKNFPNQLVHVLKTKLNLQVAVPEIIATTGWTTDELNAEIEKRNISQTYDFVTLLIGVNNQYRNRTIANFKEEFKTLLKKAVNFAKGDPNKVFVISIPDWGCTPFAKEKGHDPIKISTEIDAYNKAKRQITVRNLANYIDITTLTRQYCGDDTALTEDGLHYNANTYELWAEKIAPYVKIAFEENVSKQQI